MIHFTYEGSWLYLSIFGRTVDGSKGPLIEMCGFLTLLRNVREVYHRPFTNRERIRKRRSPLGRGQSNPRLPQNLHRLRRCTVMLLYHQPTHQERHYEALLDHRSVYR